MQAEHKKAHKSQNGILSNIFTPKVVSKPDPATGHFNPFPTFPYTGTLRPVYPLSPKREVKKGVKLPDYSKDGIPRSEQVFVNRNKIAILTKEEQDGMRKVCRLAREVLDVAAAAAKPGSMPGVHCASALAAPGRCRDRRVTGREVRPRPSLMPICCSAASMQNSFSGVKSASTWRPVATP